MLDEEHEKPRDFTQPSTDSNSYQWGRIAEHYIVIALLPAGVYGTAAAATTATLMISSFPQIRIGLMVGIGAGIPRPSDDIDIRLGDVVVSKPSGQHGGVVQYDLGKAKTGNEYERKGFLNSPPPVLLKAVAQLQAKHELSESSIPEIMAAMLQKHPVMGRSKPNYTYQGKENDRLFEATYPHTRCKNCDKCDREQEIQREVRETVGPKIHYGLIASGNTLFKDSAARDAILEELGDECLCFEMEAAGLMNDFPYLVIRGICDYGDSHKNDRWQRYAAATAAAYAKEFLGKILRTPVKLPRQGT